MDVNFGDDLTKRLAHDGVDVFREEGSATGLLEDLEHGVGAGFALATLGDLAKDRLPNGCGNVEPERFRPCPSAPNKGMAAGG